MLSKKFSSSAGSPETGRAAFCFTKESRQTSAAVDLLGLGNEKATTDAPGESTGGSGTVASPQF